ncbi:MAG: hypothetical protein GY907_03275 [Bacteroidetes bacterium]|nr:hypothetical protein [Bacteroidota bacterium]
MSDLKWLNLLFGTLLMIVAALIFVIFDCDDCNMPERKQPKFNNGETVCIKDVEVIIKQSWCCTFSYDVIYPDGKQVMDIYESSNIIKHCEV